MNLAFFASSAQSFGVFHLNTSNTACPGRCETGWTYLDKTDACYKTFFWETFDTAESVCRSVGAHLTSIHSADENHFVADVARSGFKIGWTEWTWIGLKRAEYNSERWLWTDGTKVDFLAWSKGSPDNYHGREHCGELATDNTGDANEYHKWNDIRCDHRMRAFVCKKKALH
ncbi:unnamed protein product [Cylicocyclus nassatus]|uniref:C-type lectin domain-containing protein n=1 Tax=Cylicocyclus nassatus TaxID=53992 RepID=A0AA36GWI4_CYLNA|nr:unnamed protein product [Cylicocyclus nassatus]